MIELVTFGETMALLSATRTGPLRHADTMRLGIAGAESNVAIGVSRMDRSAGWIGRVGNDELGRRIVRELRAEGLDLRGVTVDPDAPTGLMIKERRSSASTSVLYYRRGSAGSRLAPGDLDAALIGGARILHCTGITPALSATARAATFSAVEAAKAGGTLVSFDPNHRSTLWHHDEAAAVFRDLTARADILLAGEDEAEMILGGPAAPEDAARRLAERGPAHAIVKLGERGAVACVDGSVRPVPAVRVQALDPVGAGDAFAAGYLTGLLDGADAERALGLAAALGAWAVAVDGDWEGLPRRRELPLLTSAAGTVSR